MPRLRRGLQRTLEVLDFRTFVVAGAVVTLLVISYLVYTAVERARDADARADRALAALAAASAQGIDIRMAQTRRIDLLEDQVTRNSALLGRAVEANRALAAQLRALGVTPVTTGPVDSNGDGDTDLGGSSVQRTPAPAPTRPASATPRPSTRPSSRPTPRPTAAPPPSPSPSPTCRVQVAGRCVVP